MSFSAVIIRVFASRGKEVLVRPGLISQNFSLKRKTSHVLVKSGQKRIVIGK